MKIILFVFIILFFQINFVFGDCDGQSCFPSSTLPNSVNLDNIADVFAKFKNKYSHYSSELEAWLALTYPLILKATSSKHKLTCRGNLYNDLDLNPDPNRNYALIEYIVIVSDDNKKDIDMKIRFSFSDKVLAKSEKYQTLLNQSEIKKQAKNSKAEKADPFTWYELQCKKSPEAMAIYDTEIQDPVQNKPLELPIYGCFVGEGEKQREVYALYDFASGSDGLEFKLSEMRAYIHSLENDWRLDERFPGKEDYPLDCSITPLPETKDKHMYAKK